MKKAQNWLHFSGEESTPQALVSLQDYIIKPPSILVCLIIWYHIYKYKKYIYLLLGDDFRIGLVISLKVAVLAWGEAECQYSCSRTNN